MDKTQNTTSATETQTPDLDALILALRAQGYVVAKQAAPAATSRGSSKESVILGYIREAWMPETTHTDEESGATKTVAAHFTKTRAQLAAIIAADPRIQDGKGVDPKRASAYLGWMVPKFFDGRKLA